MSLGPIFDSTGDLRTATPTDRMKCLVCHWVGHVPPQLEHYHARLGPVVD